MSGSAPRIGLVSAWASRLNGGVFEALVAHVGLVRACGFEPVVFALHDRHSVSDCERLGEAEIRTFPVSGPRQIGFAPAMLPALRAARLDIVHLHGIWMYPSRAASAWAAATGGGYVISPHGMLDPWILSRGTLKKFIARSAYERRSWSRAAAFHALTEREAADIAVATGDAARTFVIPNAVPPARHQARPGEAPFVLYLGRIHPKKNLGALIDGWVAADATTRPMRARLVIAGWGEGEDVATLEQRLAALARDDIEFVGPVYGARKAVLLATARYLALPSFSEGLPVAILEAWAAGTPTLMSQHCNLPQGFAQGAAIDCGVDADSVATALRAGLAGDETVWAGRSAAASRLAAEFAPDTIASRWAAAYGALLPADRARSVA